MPTFRFREEESSVGGILAGLTVGVLAGFAVGIAMAQRVGGLAGLSTRVRRRLADAGESMSHAGYDGDDYEYAEYGEDELEEAPEDDDDRDADAELEGRVLDAFRADAVLSERAIEIGAIGPGVIEISGSVRDDGESDHAMVVADAVPGVHTVVNRLDVGREDGADDDRAAQRDTPLDSSEPLSGGQWEGQRVGTGRRRQGTSADIGRHADPKPPLETRWLDEQHAVEEAAGDIPAGADRRRPPKRAAKSADRGPGGAVSPGGVPRGDHVADPEASEGTAGPDERVDERAD